MTTQAWPSEWLRGVLEVCVLRAVAEAPTYGYAIAADLEAAGLGSIKGGTLYPLLTRFEKAGVIAPEWRTGEGGPARKYYALTDRGRTELAELSARWSEFARTVTDHLAPSPDRGTPAAPPAGRDHPGAPAPAPSRKASS
ncbi:PadR family transcriptional regulator [Georgenia faecalis]|uniref:PadR family transcriptional regulator n=1 Tax=Georgenia faecalis TaxID=2483799 RepID=A0ABV9DCS5_9MICO|nr:PadR family transcriptional regulator [Georgenia faecalis]